MCKKDTESVRCQFAKDKVFDLVKDVNQYDIKGTCFNASKQSAGEYAHWWGERIRTPNSEPQRTQSCLDFEGMEEYLNREDVKAAIFAKTTTKFVTCKPEVYKKYVYDFDVGTGGYFPGLKNAGVRLGLYSGDSDAVVPTTWTMNLVKKLKFEKSGDAWRSWSLKEKVKEEEIDRFAGFYMKFTGLTFGTINGAGHMAAMNRPRETQFLFNAFLRHADP